MSSFSAVLQPRTMSGLGSSAFARRYLRNRLLFLFLQVLRCFSSLRSLPLTMNSLKDTAIIRWVAPFGYPRIKDRSHLPAAFRKVLRPSSPLSAKAFTKCSCLLVLSLRIYKIHTQLLTIKRPPPFVRRTHLWIFAHKY